jgi:hypothetical protein
LITEGRRHPAKVKRRRSFLGHILFSDEGQNFAAVQQSPTSRLESRQLAFAKESPNRWRAQEKKSRRFRDRNIF